MGLLYMTMMVLAQAADSFPGLLTLINLGVLGISFILFSMGKIHPESTVKDLREQIIQRDKTIAEERTDSKAVRDAIIRDVAPAMARQADRDKEMVALVTRLLAWAVSQDGK